MHRDQLRIQEPCHADWGTMTGDRSRRHCGSCDKHVHDLSAMTAGDAARLTTTSKDLCVRYATRPDGTVIHAAPARRLPRLLALAGALVAATPALASSAPARSIPEVEAEGPTFTQRLRQRLLAAMGATEELVSQGQVEVVMGEMEAPPPPPPPPEMIMGKIAAPPTIQLPPPPPPAPPQPPVIPEVEEALR